MITGLDHIQLAAPPGTEDALRAYYVDLLGMTERPKPPALAARGGCWFEAGTARIHLGIDPDHHPSKKSHPGIRVGGTSHAVEAMGDEIDTFAAALAAGGAPVTWDDNLPGHRRFFSVDPVGNRLEFLTGEG
ncbi:MULTISPECIES: VOC family protein [Streptomyces]|uniref:VOC family protein n=1 Tax=Streptomyces celluloflavus TaxID=58344 RepID=A0ABW7R891_9ACTN|nr:VOC family protein [Streptomyces kasugaensis]MYU54578.1 glyoxalase [Streptomyces sp. SID7805]WSK12910.1 glyoxalase [Streptomyces celluloflavus]